MSEEENKGTQIEFAGVSLSGSKMLLVVPLLGSILGALWGGFELYQRLLTAEDALNNLPDTAEINQQLAVQAETMVSLQKSISDLQEDFVQQMNTVTILLNSAREDIDEIRQDVDQVDGFVRGIDENTSETQRDLRNDVYAMESTLNDRMREIDGQLRATRDDLEEKIERILDNPLNDSE